MIPNAAKAVEKSPGNWNFNPSLISAQEIENSFIPSDVCRLIKANNVAKVKNTTMIVEKISTGLYLPEARIAMVPPETTTAIILGP